MSRLLGQSVKAGCESRFSGKRIGKNDVLKHYDSKVS